MSRARSVPRDIILGELRREYSFNTEQEWILDSPGGNALYTAAGYLIWEEDYVPGLCTRVGEDYPQSWLDDYAGRGIDLDGVVVLPRAMDLRACYILRNHQALEVSDPLPYLAGSGESLPPGLIGFQDIDQFPASRRSSKATAVREEDLPHSYQTATGAHLCSLDYLSHNLLPAVLRRQGYSTITLNPSPLYMDPAYFGDIPSLITGLTGFIPAEDDLIKLYKGKTFDLWEMAEDLGRYGCDYIVIHRGMSGSYLFDSSTGKKFEVGGYPARVHNAIGGLDAFCGGFLAGLRQSHDPVRAALYGNVAYSMMVEGTGPFYPLKAIPGLANARLDYLESRVREI